MVAQTGDENRHDALISVHASKKQSKRQNVMFWEEKFGKINGLSGDVAYKSTHHSW